MNNLKRTVLVCFLLVQILCVSFSKEVVLSVMGDSVHYVVVILEGKKYYVQTESGKLGPYDYSSLVSRKKEDNFRSFSVTQNNVEYIISTSGEKFGPYTSIEYKQNDFLFIAKNGNNTADVLLENGEKLQLVAQTQIDEIFGSSMSADKKHWYLKYNAPDGSLKLLFDSFVIPLRNSFSKATSISGGFVGTSNTLWLLALNSYEQYHLLFIETKKTGVFPEIRALSTSSKESGHRIEFSEFLLGLDSTVDGKKPDSIKELAGFVSSGGKKNMAVKFMDGTGLWKIYTGKAVSESFVDDDPDKSALEVSSDGTCVVYTSSFEDTHTYEVSSVVTKNNTVLGIYKNAKISEIGIVEGSDKCMYIVHDNEGSKTVWIDGKKIGSSMVDARLIWRAVETGDWNSSYTRNRLFDGYIQAEYGGNTYLYKQETIVAGPFNGSGTISVFQTSQGDRFLFNRENSARDTEQLVYGNLTSKEYSDIYSPLVSEDGSALIYTVKENKKYGMYCNDKKLGTYDFTSSLAFVPGSSRVAFFFWQGSKLMLGVSDAPPVQLPNPGDLDKREIPTPVVSRDGKVIEYALKKKAMDTNSGTFDVDGYQVIVDGVSYTGSYNATAKVTVYWDEKAKGVKRLQH